MDKILVDTLKQIRCECGAHQGEFHKWGCSGEVCPFCGGQLTTCGCVCEHLRLPMPENPIECLNVTFGLTELQTKRWRRILDKKGRVPFVYWPPLCRYCGDSVEMFNVPLEEWEHYIELGHRDDMVCPICYTAIRNLIDEGTGKPYIPKADVWASVKETHERMQAYLESRSRLIQAHLEQKVHPGD